MTWYEMSFGSVQSDLSVYKMDQDLVRNDLYEMTWYKMTWYEMSFGLVRNDSSVYKMDRDLVRNDLYEMTG